MKDIKKSPLSFALVDTIHIFIYISFIVTGILLNKTFNVLEINKFIIRQADPNEKREMLPRAVEIPCPTCLTWSHFIQYKLKISIYMSLDKCKICYKVNKILYFIF